MWKSLSDEHILKFIGACAIAVKPFTVCELKRNGHILEYLKNKPSASRRKLVRGVLSRLISQLTRPQLYETSLGLKYLHKSSVIHGDVKAVRTNTQV